MFVFALGSVRSSTSLAEAADSDSVCHTSVLSDVLDEVTARRPNSLRVGNVSATMDSPLNHDEYITDHPSAAAKFCCAELASVAASFTGSTALTSITFGLSTVTNLSHPTPTRSAAAPTS